jgi:hypothetical protein
MTTGSMTTPTFGQRISRSYFNPKRSVVAVDVAPIGNVVLRVGHETSPTATTWEQSEHVVLPPDEAREFALAILAQIEPR